VPTNQREVPAIEPPGTVPPDPLSFGLTPNRLKLFRAASDVHEWLPGILAWISFIGILASPSGIRDWIFAAPNSRWPIIVIFYVPGFVLGYLLSLSIESMSDRRRKVHADYPAYLSFREATEAYQVAINAAAQAERERRSEQRKQLRKQEAWWKSLDGHRFEREVTTLLCSRGFNARWKGRSGDGGVDIEIAHEAARIIVQCKAFKSTLALAPFEISTARFSIKTPLKLG